MRALVPILVVLFGSADALRAAALEVRTEPEVEVYWEGVLLATTDADGVLLVEDVPEGPFELELRKEGFETLRTSVEVSSGTTRLTRELVPVGDAGGAAESASAADAPSSEPSGPAAPRPPAFRISGGAWVALLVLLALGGFVALRSRLPRRRAAAEPPSPEVRREPQVRRAAAPEREGGGEFLSELRQRERAMDDLVDVSGSDAASAEVVDAEIVDVAWKEVD